MSKKTYSVLVTEHFVTRFRVEADTPEEAESMAEGMAIDGNWGDSESVECDRTTSVEDAADMTTTNHQPHN